MMTFLIAALVGGIISVFLLNWIHHHVRWHYIGLLQIALSGCYLSGLFYLAAWIGKGG